MSAGASWLASASLDEDAKWEEDCSHIDVPADKLAVAGELSVDAAAEVAGDLNDEPGHTFAKEDSAESSDGMNKDYWATVEGKKR